MSKNQRRAKGRERQLLDLPNEVLAHVLGHFPVEKDSPLFCVRLTCHTLCSAAEIIFEQWRCSWRRQGLLWTKWNDSRDTVYWATGTMIGRACVRGTCMWILPSIGLALNGESGPHAHCHRWKQLAHIEQSVRRRDFVGIDAFMSRQMGDFFAVRDDTPSDLVLHVLGKPQEWNAQDITLGIANYNDKGGMVRQSLEPDGDMPLPEHVRDCAIRAHQLALLGDRSHRRQAEPNTRDLLDEVQGTHIFCAVAAMTLLLEFDVSMPIDKTCTTLLAKAFTPFVDTEPCTTPEDLASCGKGFQSCDKVVLPLTASEQNQLSSALDCMDSKRFLVYYLCALSECQSLRVRLGVIHKGSGTVLLFRSHEQVAALAHHLLLVERFFQAQDFVFRWV